jgi:hypothetical protein
MNPGPASNITLSALQTLVVSGKRIVWALIFPMLNIAKRKATRI